MASLGAGERSQSGERTLWGHSEDRAGGVCPSILRGAVEIAVTALHQLRTGVFGLCGIGARPSGDFWNASRTKESTVWSLASAAFVNSLSSFFLLSLEALYDAAVCPYGFLSLPGG